MKYFIKKSSCVLFLVLFEFLFLFLFKDGAGAYKIESGFTIAEFLRIHGKFQFLVAAYIQKVFVFGLLTYLIFIAAILIAGKEVRTSNFLISLNQLKVSWLAILGNIASFFALLALFLIIKSPDTLIANPYSWKSILYTLNPLIWGVYLYTICNLFFPLKRTFELAVKNKLLLGISLLVSLALLYPGLMYEFTDFWSNLLLVPTIQVASAISHFFGLHYQVLPELVDGFPVFGTAQFAVQIAPACSGYEGMTLIVILLGCYCFIQKDSLRVLRSLLMIPIAGLAMFILNSVRIFALVAIGHYWSPQVALDGFHTVAGWLNLLVVFVASLFALNFIPYFQRTEKVNQHFHVGDNALLLPLITLMVIGLIGKAATADFSWLYPVPILLTTFVVYLFRKPFLLFLARPSVISVGIGIIVFAIWIYLVPADSMQSAHFFVQLNLAPLWLTISWLLFRVAGASLLVPIAEEFAFRGYIQPKLQMWFEQCGFKSISIILSLGITALLFGFVHSNILAGSIAGVFYGLAYLQRRQLIDAVIAHAVTNALLALYVITFGYWSYW